MKIETEKMSEVLSLRVAITTAIIFVGTVLFYYFSWKSLANFQNSINFGEPLFCDFDRHYYPMGKMIFATKFPVPGYFYTPLFAIIMNCFSRFELQQAKFIWGVVQIALILQLCFVSAIYFTLKERKESLFYVTTAAYLLSIPIVHGFRWGQISVLLVFLVLVSMLFYKNGNKITSALLLALAAGIKYYPAVFLIYFIIKKDLKYVIWFTLFLLSFLYLVPGLAIGFGPTIAFYKFVNHFIAEAVSWLPKAGDSQYISHVIYRITGENDNFPFIFYKLFGVLIFIFNVWLGYFLARKKIFDNIVLSFVLIFLSFPFIISTSWPHYLAYLPFCQVYVFQLLLSKRVKISGIWLAVVPVIASFVLSSSILFVLCFSWARYSYYGALFFSNLSLLIGLYISVVFVAEEKLSS